MQPERSSYFNRHFYNELEEVITQMGASDVCLLGDLNSRTAQLDDILDTNIFADSFVVETAGFPARVSEDNHTNNMGYELIGFCRACQMVIVNGRAGTDAGIGKATCKNASVVDYAIVSHSLFPLVREFCVLEYNELFSDIHCPVSIQFTKLNQFDVKESNDSSEDKTKKSTFINWNKYRSGEYADKLDRDEISSLEQELEIMTNDFASVSQDMMNIVVGRVNKVLLDGADTLGIVEYKIKKTRKFKRKSDNKPWFNDECKLKRRVFVKARRNALRHRSDNVLNTERRRAAKDYKKCVRKHLNHYKLNLATRLRQSQSSDPKVFWNILNGKKKKNAIQSNRITIPFSSCLRI